MCEGVLSPRTTPPSITSSYNALASDSAKGWHANANLRSIPQVNPQYRAAPSGWPYPFRLSLHPSGYFASG